MRTELLTYLTEALTGSIKTSQELPWAEGNNPLYLKNMRRVYLDETVKTQSQLVPVLDSSDIMETVNTVKGYLALDAKNRNADLDTALAVLAGARTAATISNAFRKEFDYTSSINGDTIVYEFEYRFHTLT